ncbi:MAG: hypothetical protein V2A73_16110 [Pseudomonadota bacterium]
MAAKPTELPTWATNGGTDPLTQQSNVLEPPASKKASGFHYREKPARNYLNWLLNLIYQWCAYLDTFLEDDHTWSGDQTFDEFCHGDQVLSIPIAAAEAEAGGWLFDSVETTWEADVPSNGKLIVPIPLDVGDRIKSITVYVNAGSNTDQGLVIYLISQMMSGVFRGASIATAQPGAPGSPYVAVVMTLGAPVTVIAGKKWELEIQPYIPGQSGDTKKVLGVEVTFDHPAA